MHSIRNQRKEPSQKTGFCEPSSMRIRNSSEPVSAAMLWTFKAMRIPEIVFLIQEQLPRPELLISLQVARQWYRTGQALVWRRVHWDNTMATEPGEPLPESESVLGVVLSKESLLFKNAYRIRSLDCMFHSQGRTSNVDSSSLLRLLILGKGADLSSQLPKQESSMRVAEADFTAETRNDLHPRNSRITPSRVQRQNNLGLDSLPEGQSDQGSDDTVPVRAIQLRQLMLKGHFDLLSSAASTSSTIANGQGADRAPIPTFVAFKIPTLTRLEIHPLVNSAVDIHLILDSALRLEELVIHSHGHFIDSRLVVDTNDAQDKACSSSQKIHRKLRSLKIQYLKISREELQQIADRCPNVTEFQSLCTPGALWKQRPPLLQQQSPPAGTGLVSTSSTGTVFISTTIPGTAATVDAEQLSIICSLARSWPRLERMHVGQQQGGFHLDSLRETLCAFPRLESIGIPAWDCTKVTMDAIKATQIHAMSSADWSSEPSSSTWSGSLASEARLAPAKFLTSLCIMNVCSSEKVSQALHDYLCWTPHLKEFYAYNTTLYVDQMNNQQELSSGVTATPTPSPSIAPTGATESSSSQAPPLQEGQKVERKRWACSGLERLVVRFARQPWRNLSEPPRRSKETFGFLENLQNLKHLCIKEGLMLEAGREYEALGGLSRLEEVVFTTCYPIPIKVEDMKSWMPLALAEDDGTSKRSVLKKVVVRRQKANTILDRELGGWFQESRPDLDFRFELTDCCEEDYSFHHG
ncbi:hypothetical protein EMPS_07377 [Entomortierella parvispora]|uniref:F-box domain-containing protein n=1 Tax=Entomortierella parvispora TaxID=205924 RepID=A0A9P3HE34_9FUNG|nr:hypothetical protein EMPS_07377 [Entomortierella parvispora]